MSQLAKKPNKKKKRASKARTAKGVSDDPILTAVRASFRPFDTEKGVAAPLDDGRPSQKFMAKAQTQITLASGQMFAFMVAPNVASNSDYASVVFAIGAASGGSFVTNGFWSGAALNWGTLQTLSTSTPYTAATLSTNYNYALVGSGLKFTYEGAELYRGGTLRYMYDRESGYNATGVWGSDSVSGLVAYVNSSANTIRQSLNKDNVVEINTIPTSLSSYQISNSVTATAYTNGSTQVADIGLTASPSKFGINPTVLGYYVNTSGNAISFHVDCVEHWSLTSPDIQSLQTPSYAHATMASHVRSVMDNARQIHAGRPNEHHASVAADTVNAMKSPIGHEVLNIGLRAALA